MNHDHDESGLTVGGRDPEPAKLLDAGLDAYDLAATGTTVEDQGELSVRAVDPATGETVGGPTAWTWGGLLGIDMPWVREDHRRDGRGSGLLRAAEAEARRRGRDRAVVSSFAFRAPDFYRRHGYAETGRTLGIPGGARDVRFHEILAADTP